MSSAPRKIGRPTALTAEVQDMIVEYIAGGATQTAAIDASGISRPTFYENVERPEFADFRVRVTRARAKLRALLEQSLATEKDWRARLEYLRAIHREDWGKQETVAHSFPELKGKTEAELVARAEQLIRKAKGEGDAGSQ